MATQGVLSIFDEEEGDVIIKVITGSEGSKIPELAKEIRTWNWRKQQDIIEVYKAAFATIDAFTLVVMNFSGSVLRPPVNMSDELYLPDLYYETFNDPHFNPRWEHGTADYVEVIQLTTK